MLSQNQLVWVGGAAASAVAVVGALAGALYWTHPDFLWPSPPPPQVLASAPEPKAPSAAPAAPAAEPPALAPAASPSGGEAASEAPVPPPKPAFDAVNVEPTGEAVIAGRAAPNAKVELRDDGKTLAEATADASGEFVIIPPALAPGDHSLSLAAPAGAAAPETSKVVAVSVPQPQAKVASAGATAPAAPAPAAPAPSPPSTATLRTLATPQPSLSRVAIRSVEADAAGGLIAKGSAGPNATVRFYLNGSTVADAKTQSDGRWSLTIRNGMSPGGYMIRADEINPGDASVVATADTPFDYPAPPGAAAPPALGALRASAPAPAQPKAPLSADAVVDSVQTAQVRAGHTLWALSQNFYGDPTRYPVIYEANRWEIHNPNLIYPGEVVVLPTFGPRP